MTSPDPQGLNSPSKPSLASMFPSDFSTNLDSVHAPMQSIFGDNSIKPGAVRTPSLQSPPSVRSPLGLGLGQPIVTKEPFFPTSSSLLNNSRKDMNDSSMPIPVKVVSSSSSSHGLKSPSVLQHVSSNNNNNSNNSSGSNNITPNSKPANPFQFPIVSKPESDVKSPNEDAHSPMSNLFDPLGKVKDADDNIKAMRQRFEEAKQRMALSLPAREGGLRPNSLLARSMFDDGKFSNSWADDGGSFLLDQLRRRHKRRMETPAAPHPELTPQQRQHISERTATAAAASTPLNVMPSRRAMLPGGSVAERVLMFEKSPSAIGLESGQTRIVPIRREPTVTGTALTPWRSTQHYEQQVGILLTSKISFTLIVHLLFNMGL